MINIFERFRYPCLLVLGILFSCKNTSTTEHNNLLKPDSLLESNEKNDEILPSIDSQDSFFIEQEKNLLNFVQFDIPERIIGKDSSILTHIWNGSFGGNYLKVYFQILKTSKIDMTAIITTNNKPSKSSKGFEYIYITGDKETIYITKKIQKELSLKKWNEILNVLKNINFYALENDGCMTIDGEMNFTSFNDGGKIKEISGANCGVTDSLTTIKKFLLKVVEYK